MAPPCLNCDRFAVTGHTAGNAFDHVPDLAELSATELAGGADDRLRGRLLRLGLLGLVAEPACDSAAYTLAEEFIELRDAVRAAPAAVCPGGILGGADPILALVVAGRDDHGLGDAGDVVDRPPDAGEESAKSLGRLTPAALCRPVADEQRRSG
jgi:hypothetical protein